MKKMRVIRSVMVTLSLVGFCVPSVAFATEPAPQPVVTDIALGDGGTLQGQLIDLQGGAVTGMPVALRSQNRVVAATTTAADGRFTAQGLQGGVYEVAAGEGQGVYRFWTPGTAPPSAQQGAIVYTQNGCGCEPRSGRLKAFLTNPIVIGAIVATAIAVPVALNNTGGSASP